MNRFFPILGLVILMISSCRKDESFPPDPPPGTNYNYISSSLSPYKFKVGTYWVYENDSTGVLDSIVVDTVSTGFFISVPTVHGTTDQTKTEFYKMNIHSFGSSNYYNESLLNNYIMRNYSGDYSNFQGQPIFAANSAIGSTSNGMTILAKFPTIAVNTNTFNNVDEVKITAAAQYQPEFLFDTYLYYTDSVGLVKKETMLSPTNIESWSIKRWNIIRY